MTDQNMLGGFFRKIKNGGKRRNSTMMDSELLKKANEELYKQGVELAFKNKALSLLDDLYELASNAIELNEVAAKLAGRITSVLSIPFSAIITYSSENKSFSLTGYAESGGLTETNIIKIGASTSDRSYAGFSILTGKKRIILPPAGKMLGPFCAGDAVDYYVKMGVVAVAVHPLITERGPIGLLVFGLNRPVNDLSAFEKEAVNITANVVAITLDKTIAYNALKEANLRLQELDAQKTDFLSIATHQLRTPLSIAKGYLELLGEEAYGKTTKQMREVFSDMERSNDRLVQLVDEFLDITRIEQGRVKFAFADADVNDLTESVVKELEQRAKDKKLHLGWHRNPRVGKVNMDAEKVRNVIFNFVDNAIKYSNEGTVAVSVASENGGVAVRVKDNGLGFEKVDEVNFFQKFYRGKNVSGINVTGTGLGLYVCRRFIEAHGGRVWARSSGLGKGSEFGFWLPLRPVAGEETA